METGQKITDIEDPCRSVGRSSMRKYLTSENSGDPHADRTAAAHHKGKQGHFSAGGGGRAHCHERGAEETMEYISRYSLYAYENEMRQGFLTVEGGHRVGVAGKVIMEKEKVKNIQYISSLISGCPTKSSGAPTHFFLILLRTGSMPTLIISPPGCGKTTLIRI